jgi:hypothetical protein
VADRAFPTDFPEDTTPAAGTTIFGSDGAIRLDTLVGPDSYVGQVISAGKVFALQQISTNGVQIAESTTLVEILAIDLYVATSAQTAPSWRLIFGAYGLHLVPSDYGGAGVVTINGVADIVTFAEAGIYLLVGDGANAWTLTPATDYSAIDGAIAAVQADATQALSDAAAANTLAQDAYNGLSGKLDVAGHTALSIPASTAGTLADVAASSNDTLFGRVAGAFGFFNVTLSMIAAAVKSAAQNVESLRQIDTATPAAIGTAAAGSSVKAAASDHVHALMSSGTADFGSAAITTTGNVTGSLLKSGSGSPESSVTATVGALYRDTSSGRVYMKMSGSGNTGWVGMTPDGVDPAQIQIIASGTTATIGDHVRWVFIATGSGDFTLTGAAIVIGKEVEIQKTSTDANTIMYGRAGSENVQGVAANYALPLSSAANYPAWSVKDIDASNRWVS